MDLVIERECNAIWGGETIRLKSTPSLEMHTQVVFILMPGDIGEDLFSMVCIYSLL